MKKMITALAAAVTLCGPMPSLADPSFVPFTYDAMGCMKLRECTDEVYPLLSVDVLKEQYPSMSFSEVEEEADRLLTALNDAGINVYLASAKYFPRSHRGSYYTDTNTFFLNANHMWDEHVFLQVLRHEAWHAAQDCMAGSLDNSMIAVIHLPETVPQKWKLDASVRYASYPAAIPWEQEAIWAGHTPEMSYNAIASCASDTPMWEDYPPTPKTQQWLEAEGYL